MLQPMARLITPLEQHLDRMPSTVVIQATTWWETVLALVKQACQDWPGQCSMVEIQSAHDDRHIYTCAYLGSREFSTIDK